MTKFLSSRPPAVVLVLVVLVLSLSSSPALAQREVGSLTGTVVGFDGETPTRGEVTIVDLRRQTTLDDEGGFVFEDLPVGSYLLTFTTPTQGHAVVRATVVAGETRSVEVELHVVSLSEEVIVSVGPEARSSLEVVTPTTVVSGEELQLRSSGTLGGTLTSEPGISETSYAGGASRPVIRGLEGDRVRILQGGVGAGDVSALSPDHAVSLDVASAERIEIIRGPASLLYGSSAIGGVVNVEDTLIPLLRATEPIGGQADLWFGTVANEYGAGIQLDGGSDRFAWHLQGSLREADDYTIPGAADVDEPDDEGDRPLENSDFKRESVGVGGSWFFGDAGFLGVSVSGFKSDYGLPGGHGHHEEEHGHDDEEHHDDDAEHHDDDEEHHDDDEEHHDDDEEHHDDDEEHHDDDEEHHDDDEEEGVRIDMDRKRVDLRGEINKSFGLFRGFRGRLGVVDYEHQEFESGAVGTTYLQDSAEGRFEFVQQQRGRLSGSIGLQLGREDLRVTGAEAFIPDTETSNWGLFAFEELDYDKWSLQFGGRIDGRDLDPAEGMNPNRSFTGWSASVGTVFRPSEDSAVGVSLARSTKFPNAAELYADGPHLGTTTYEIGNPLLDEETSLGLDLFYRRTVGRVVGEITLFCGFLRPGNCGSSRMRERRGRGLWTRLLKDTGAPGVHFDDYPELSAYPCPECRIWRRRIRRRLRRIW